LPYLIRWVAEGVVGALKDGAQSESDGKVLEVLMDVVSALLENSALFVEPYVRFSYQTQNSYSDFPRSYIKSFPQYSLPSSTPPFRPATRHNCERQRPKRSPDSSLSTRRPILRFPHES